MLISMEEDTFLISMEEDPLLVCRKSGKTGEDSDWVNSAEHLLLLI